MCLRSYVHGGYELLFNSYAVSYFKKDWWGAEIGNRHNLEVRQDSPRRVCMYAINNCCETAATAPQSIST